ncbi:MAG: hypothetical protein WA138_14005 [Parvibaculum sp.]
MRAAFTLALLACLAVSGAAHASTFSDIDYKSALAALDKIEVLIDTTRTSLVQGMTQDDAQARLPHLKERLQWMRDTKVAAARIDTSHTLRTRNAESQRAQCIIMRAGLMDEAFQDVMVNVSMKARGARKSELLPMQDAPNTSKKCR